MSLLMERWDAARVKAERAHGQVYSVPTDRLNHCHACGSAWPKERYPWWPLRVRVMWRRGPAQPPRWTVDRWGIEEPPPLDAMPFQRTFSRVLKVGPVFFHVGSQR